ncbi:MAG: DUF4105 domain-containing protein [Candidatus Margulisbacteria bacterium]|jgi:hypothetical protein|nr:DUF4105 domain-containing protein [Candidatus Margulisiibacteriota bacterium]
MSRKIFVLLFVVRLAAAEYWQSAEWLDLLYYESSGGGYQSLALAPEFFVTARGASDPELEYRESLALVRQNDLDFKLRFPLRYKYLARQDGLPYEPAVIVSSPYKKAYLAYPNRYIRNPISIFGHLFLLLDQEWGLPDGQLVHILADSGDEPEDLLFYYKGLTGKYIARFWQEPYYRRSKQDSYLESRDVLFYDLGLSAEQLENLHLHFKEVQNAGFYYYYIDANCALFIGRFLNVVVGRTVVTKQFYLLPAQVFNAYQRLDPERPVILRASLVKEFNRRYQLLSAAQKRTVRALLRAETFSTDREALETFLLISNYVQNNQPQYAGIIRRNRITAYQTLLEIYPQKPQARPDAQLIPDFVPVNNRSWQAGWADGYASLAFAPVAFTEYEQLADLEIVNLRLAAVGLRVGAPDWRLKFTPVSLENITQANAVLPVLSYALKSSFTYDAQRGQWGGAQELYAGYAFNLYGRALVYALGGGDLTNYADFGAADLRPLALLSGVKLGLKQPLMENLDLRLVYEHKYQLDRQSVELLYKTGNIVGKLGYAQTAENTEYSLGLEALY